MKRTISLRLGAFLLVATVAAVLFIAASLRTDAHAQDTTSPKERAAPVEDDMHEFMEYVFQPAYKRLKVQMAAEPANNESWKAIKSDSLILAEGGNLLLIRLPEEDAKDWMQHSVQARDLGGQLYQAAKKKDYKSARQHYEAMLTKCNACHQQFAGGEHQLMP